MGLLEDIRKKPKPVRNQYAFFSALILTAIIAGVWALSIPARFSETVVSTEAIEEQSGAFSKYFGELKESAANVIDSIKEEGDLDEVEEETFEEGIIDIDSLLQQQQKTDEDEIERILPRRRVLIATSSPENDTFDEGAE